MLEIPFNHSFDTLECIKRLVTDYNKHKNLIIAFDFDNTIYDYHNNGGNYQCVIELLKECSDLGFTMVLFTANENAEKLDFCKMFCAERGIRIDYVNESPIMPTRKPYYNILLDDRAGLESAFTALYCAVTVIKSQANE